MIKDGGEGDRGEAILGSGSHSGSLLATGEAREWGTQHWFLAVCLPGTEASELTEDA